RGIEGADDVLGDGSALRPVRARSGLRDDDQPVDLVWRDPRILYRAPERQEAPSTHRGLGFFVPAPGSRRVPDTDGRYLPSVLPYPHALFLSIHRGGSILDVFFSFFPPTFSSPRKPLFFSSSPPLGNLLAVCGRLEHDLYTGSHGDLVHRSSREVGVHLDTRV